MKWFKHESDAHTNMKLQALIDKLGIAGYGYYWACVELVASQGGDTFRVAKDKHWEQHLKKMLSIEPKEQKKYLVVLATHNLIDLKALKNGDLYIPKLEERCDEYSEKKKRSEAKKTLSGQGRDNVGLEEKREEKKRREKTATEYLLNIPEKDMEEFYKRFDCSKKAIKSKGEDMLLWCKNNEFKKDNKAFLLNALKKDFQERKEPIKKVEFVDGKATVTEQPTERVAIPEDIKKSVNNIIGNMKVA